MPRISRRFAVLATVGVLGVPLTVVATAFACANLATVKLNRAAATPGTQVSFQGRNFNSNPAASPVSVRWNGRNGKVLFEGRPARSGKLSATFTVPQARSGYYIVVATQVAPNGKPAPGTPGRAPLRVRSSGGSSNSTVVAPVTSGGGPAAPQALAIGLGLSAFMLVGGLSTMVVRRRRVANGLSSTA